MVTRTYGRTKCTKRVGGKETIGLAYSHTGISHSSHLSLAIGPHCSRERGKNVLKVIGDSVHAPKSGWKTRQYLILPEGNPVE